MQSSTINRAIGKCVRNGRKSMGLTMFALLRMADFPVQPGYLSKLERGQGQWSASALCGIAEALGMKPSELMKQAEEMAGGEQIAA